MSVVVLTPPVLPSLAEVKAHIKVDGDDDDALIGAYLAAAVGHIDGPEGILGRCVLRQRLEYRPACGGRVIALPYGPVTAVEEAAYSPTGVAAVVFGPDEIQLRGDQIALTSGAAWPEARDGDLSVSYWAGSATLHPSILAAILLMVGDLYAHRETVIAGGGVRAEPLKTPASVENLLWPFRVLTF